MDSVKFDALDMLAGEVLPERAVLGVFSTPFSGGGAQHGAVSTSACQATHAEGTPGLVGALGLGSNNPSSSLTCVPAATAVF